RHPARANRRPAAAVTGAHSRAPADPATAPAHPAAGPGNGTAPESPPLLLASGAESIVAAFEGRLSETLAMLGATGAPGEVTKLATLGTITAPMVVAVGLGPEPTGAAPAGETLRRAAAAAVPALAGCSTGSRALPLSGGHPDDGEQAAALRGSRP